MNQSTSVLIRVGFSLHWSQEYFGNKEIKLAALQKQGFAVFLIDHHGLKELLEGRPAPVIEPLTRGIHRR